METRYFVFPEERIRPAMKRTILSPTGTAATTTEVATLVHDGDDRRPKRPRQTVRATGYDGVVHSHLIPIILRFLSQPCKTATDYGDMYLLIADLRRYMLVDRTWRTNCSRMVAALTKATLLETGYGNAPELRQYSYIRTMKTYLRQHDLFVCGRKKDMWDRISRFQIMPVPNRIRRRILGVKRCVSMGLRGSAANTEHVRGNKRLALMSMPHGRDVYRRVTPELQQDREIILGAVALNGCRLQVCPKWTKVDDGVVLTAVSNNGRALEYANVKYLKNLTYIMKAAETYGFVIRWVAAEFKDREAFVKRCIQTNPWAYRYASDRLQRRPDIVQFALSLNGYLLRWMDPKFQHRDNVYIASKTCKDILFHFPTYRDDLAIVRNIVGLSEMALYKTTHRVRSNRELLLRAVKCFGGALEYATEDLRDNFDVVLAAVRQNGMAIVYASATMQSNPTIALEALKNTWQVWTILPNRLKSDPAFLMSVSTSEGVCNYVRRCALLAKVTVDATCTRPTTA